MRLSALRLTNFRNFADQRLEIPASGLAIVGDNGQGKTNLLEAIYYLEVFRSFRGASDEQLVRFGQDVFRVEARVEGDGPARTVAAAFDRHQRRKKVSIDGVEAIRLGDAIGRLGVVIFSPSDVALIAGPPSARRRYLDILLSLSEPRYLEYLQRYRQILLRRNAVLRAGGSPAQIEVWNDGLVRSGSRVVSARMRWVAMWRGAYAERFGEIAGGTQSTLEYESSITVDPTGTAPTTDEVALAFLEDLRRVADRERRRAISLVGPHRDDLRIRAASGGGGEWVDLRVFGSGGQQRTGAVALRMIEGETLRDRLGSDPIILLDDVFAELDTGRSRRILDWVDAESGSQVILTAPKPADFALRGGNPDLWRIENGVVSRL